MARSADTKCENELSFLNLADESMNRKLTGAFASNELVEFSSDGKYLATANGRAIRIWDLAAGHIVQAIDTLGRNTVGIAWMNNASVLLVVTEDRRMRVLVCPPRVNR